MQFRPAFGARLSRIAQVMEIGDAEDLPGSGVVIADQLAVLRGVGDAMQIDNVELAGLPP